MQYTCHGIIELACLTLLHFLAKACCWKASIIGGVEITPLMFVTGMLFLKFLADAARCILLSSLLWQKNTVNVWQDTTSSDGDTAQQLAQFLVVADCQLDVAGHDTGLLVVTSGITCQL